MIKIENDSVHGFEQAICSMRNPKNSWLRSDSISSNNGRFTMGENDLKLATTLANAGTEHGKFLRMINIYVDITAPLYWYKEMDTYKVGTVCNSCSTMHKIHEKEFTLDDFSHEHLLKNSKNVLTYIVDTLNRYRDIYLNGGDVFAAEYDLISHEPKDKQIWWQLIQLLPSSYNQKRTYMLNYATLRAIYHQRKDHKLDEWHTFCDWIKTLPYAEELIVGDSK